MVLHLVDVVAVVIEAHWVVLTLNQMFYVLSDLTRVHVSIRRRHKIAIGRPFFKLVHPALVVNLKQVGVFYRLVRYCCRGKVM